MTTNARRGAVETLIRIHRDGSYSNIATDAFLKASDISKEEKALYTRLVYGVIERRLTIDYCIDTVSSMPLKRMHPTVRDILRVGVYQLLYMDKIPASAAVNEAVKLAKKMGQVKAAGFINAVLRNVQRQTETMLENLPETIEGDVIRYSVPAELLAYWRRNYGNNADQMLATLNDPPPQSIRVNTLQISTEDFCSRLEKAGVLFALHPHLPDSLHILSGSEWKGVAKIQENWYYYQDTASQYCCLALGALPHERIADICAAPGGKSFTIAQYMKNKGALLSCDIYDKKCEVMASRAKELGISCIKTVTRDGSAAVPAEWKNAFDRVLCDVPCSGYGVIRRKPEIRYKSLSETETLPALQLEILSRSAEMVKQGGVLQYSTCTLRPEENEKVVAAFLESHPDFSPRELPLSACFEAAGISSSHQITLFPHIHGTDGFFIASFERNEKL